MQKDGGLIVCHRIRRGRKGRKHVGKKVEHRKVCTFALKARQRPLEGKKAKWGGGLKGHTAVGDAQKLTRVTGRPCEGVQGLM